MDNGEGLKEVTEFPISDCDDSIIDTLTDWVERGQSLDVQDEHGKTALNFYSSQGRIKVVEFLLDRGANPNITDVEGSTPLHFTTSNRRTDLLNLFIKKGVDLNVKDNTGLTLLHRACLFNLVDHIKMLLENGASPGVKNDDGESPFHFAAGLCGVDVLGMFLSNGADIYDEDYFGRTLCDSARKSGKDENIKFLLEKEAEMFQDSFIPLSTDYSQSSSGRFMPLKSLEP